MEFNSLFGPEGFIDYYAGWLRIGRRWIGIWRGRPVVIPVFAGGTSANTTQEDFWFRNDDGSLTTATYMGAQNSNQTIAGDTPFRIRIIMQENNGKTDPWSFQIGAQKNGSGGYTLITTGRTDGIQYSDDGNSIADGSAIATGDFDLTYSGTPTAGEYDDAQTSAGTSTIGLNGTYTEIEFCLVIDTANAVNGDYWDLHVLDTGGGALDGYTITPRVTASISATLTAEFGSFSLTGQAADLLASRYLEIEQGSISLTGQDVIISRGKRLEALFGAFGITGQASGLLASRYLEIGQGSFTLTGYAAGLVKGWVFPFTDGFESGDVSAWDGSNGSPTINGTAALDGSYGMQLPYNAGLDYVYLEWTNTTHQVYRVKFKIDVSTLTGNDGDWETVFLLNDGSYADWCAAISIGRVLGSNVVSVFMHEDDDGYNSQASSGISGTVTIEAEFHFADTNGYVDWWIDGSPQTSLTGQDTGTRYPDQSWFGGTEDNTGAEYDSGSFYLDSFELHDTARAGGLVAEFGSFVLTGQDTGLLGSRYIEIVQGSISLTGQITGLSKVYRLSSAFGSFVLTGQDTGLLGSRYIEIVQGTITLTGQAAGTIKLSLVTAGQGLFTFSGYDVGLICTHALAAEFGAFSLTGQASGLLASRYLEIEQGSISLTGQDAGLAKGRRLEALFGAFSLTGQAAGLLASRYLEIDQGSISLTGQDAIISRGKRLEALFGAFGITGQASGLLASRYLEIGQGSISLTGQDVGFVPIRVLGMGQGSFSLTGIAAGLVYSGSGDKTLTAAFGTFGLTGQEIGLLAALVLAMGQGSISLTGQDAGLYRGFVLTVEQGSISLTGQNVGLTRVRVVAADQGSFILTGQAAGLVAAWVLGMEQGSITLTGQDVNLIYQLIRLIIEQDAFIVQVQEQDAFIYQVQEQDAFIVQEVEQDAVLKGTYEL